MAKYTRGHAIKCGTFSAQTNLKVSISGSTESVLTKDDPEGYDIQDLIGKGWTVQMDCYETSNLAQAKALITQWKLDSTTVSTDVGGGTAILTQLDIDCTNRQKISISATWTGIGAFTLPTPTTPSQG